MGKGVRDTLNIATIGELAAVSLDKLQKSFGDGEGHFLYNMARGEIRFFPL
jgi:nucleotidyltransferase/DNA polymerase involved in DNA repair